MEVQRVSFYNQVVKEDIEKQINLTQQKVFKKILNILQEVKEHYHKTFVEGGEASTKDGCKDIVAKHINDQTLVVNPLLKKIIETISLMTLMHLTNEELMISLVTKELVSPEIIGELNNQFTFIEANKLIEHLETTYTSDVLFSFSRDLEMSARLLMVADFLKIMSLENKQV
jgi:hypothetical protein